MNQEGRMKHAQVMKLTTLMLGVALVLGLFAVDLHAQTSAPPAPPAQQEGTPRAAPGAADKGAAPQATTPDTRGERPPAAQQSPNVTIDNRNETRSTEGDRSGKILGVDPMVAMVIGAVLVVIIVVALVSMSKRTEDIPTHRSV
jgi:hypothetical protein